ncbi:MAG: ABC transporter substrate-binding protein [Acidisphaera sp.]|nr:ABC transporter substrate-binding protein [Acidisphaera sp.]
MTLSRRTVLLAPAFIAATSLASAARADELESTVVIRTTGGVFEAALKRDFFEPFTKATGVRVIPVAASAGEMLAKSRAMQESGRVEWDIISPQYDDLPNLAPLLMDLGDCTSIPNISRDGVPGTCGRWGELYLTGAELLAFNPQAFPQRKPSSWNDFYDVEVFPGRRALSNTGVPWGMLIQALCADGVPREALFPLDLDRAFRKLDTIKPHISVWWRTGDQSQALMRSGDVVMQTMWLGRAYASRRAGVPIEWTFNQSVADFGAWAILKGAPHPNAAKAFLNFYMENPEAHTAFAREMGYTTSSRDGQALLSPEDKEGLVATPETFAKIIHIDPAWLAANRAPALERWNRWLAA